MKFEGVAKPQTHVAFVVVETASEWRVVELCERYDYANGAKFREKGCERLWSAQQILAVFPTKLDADAALSRAQTLEKQLRPLWQVAVEAELAARTRMMDAVFSELRRGL